MSEPAENLPERVTRLESRMADVHELASSASREVGDVHARLRAHTKSLEALRKTQVDQGKQIREGFKRVDEGFARVDADMRGGFSDLKAGQVQITMLLNEEFKRRGETDGPSDEADG